MLVMDRLLTQIKQCEQVGSSDKMAADIFIPNADCDIFSCCSRFSSLSLWLSDKTPIIPYTKVIITCYITGNHAINPECNMTMCRYKLL